MENLDLNGMRVSFIEEEANCFVKCALFTPFFFWWEGALHLKLCKTLMQQLISYRKAEISDSSHIWSDIVMAPTVFLISLLHMNGQWDW